MTKMTLSEELSWRGFVNQTTYKDLSVLNGEPITFYWGVDPSADSMQVGNLAAAMMVKVFIKHGHHPVLLVGGATGMIGDPDGKAQERGLMSLDELSRNKQAIIMQYHQLFGESSGLQVTDNFEWFKDINYLDFLRDTGKDVPMRQMLARDFIKTRLGDDAVGISYAEFSYVLIQAYDFLELHKSSHNVTLQLCGSDQWGNCIAGVELIRRKTGDEVNVLSMPLVINKTTGQKFGKSEDGAVWIDPKKTSPAQFYQFWINVDDEGTLNYLKIYTDLDKEEIDDLITRSKAAPADRLAQKALAKEVTTIVHGKEMMEQAEQITEVLTGKVAVSDASEAVVDAIRSELPSTKVSKDALIVDVLVGAGLASSKTEATRLVTDKAIYVNGKAITSEKLSDDDFENGLLLLRRGKAFKDTALVELN